MRWSHHSERAEAARAEARVVVTALADTLPDLDLRERFLRGAAAVLPPAPAPGPRAVAPGGAGA